MFGLVVFAWTVTLLPSLSVFFAAKGVLPHPLTHQPAGLWDPLSIFSGEGSLAFAYIALLIASICLTFGTYTRAAAVIVWLGVLAFTRRDPFVFNSGDGLIRIIAFYLMLTPAGASMSVDSWRRARTRLWTFEARPVWALRLLQVQVSIMYLTAFWDKLRSGPLWNDGTALSYVLRIKDVDRFATPTFATNSVPINLLTYGTMAIEISVGLLIWNRRLRPWMLGLAVCLHLGIEYSIRVGFFSLAAITALAAFLPADYTERTLLALHDRVRIRRAGRLERRSAKPQTSG